MFLVCKQRLSVGSAFSQLNLSHLVKTHLSKIQFNINELRMHIKTKVCLHYVSSYASCTLRPLLTPFAINSSTVLCTAQIVAIFIMRLSKFFHCCLHNSVLLITEFSCPLDFFCFLLWRSLADAVRSFTPHIWCEITGQ